MLSRHQAFTKNVDTEILNAIKLEIFSFTLNTLQMCTRV